MDITQILIGNKCKYVENEKSLSKFMSGGRIKLVFYPNNYLDTINLIKKLQKNKINFAVLGNGSNTLIKDDGYDGNVCCVKAFDDIYVFNNCLYVCSGVKLPKLSQVCSRLGLSGIEELSGIPACLGGGIYNNCGAFGKEISDLVEYVDAIKDGALIRLKKEELSFGYRQSIFQNKEYFILAALLKFKKKSKILIDEKMQEYKIKREKTQPKGISLGSVFKRVNNCSAGYFIDKAGLKGLQIGGAKVSDKHANFIMNVGNATTNDFIELARLVSLKVDKTLSVGLQFEVEILE